MIKSIKLVALLLITSAQPIAAQEWNQWRGPTRNGSVDVRNSPTSWPKEFKSVWSVEVGEGYSSPVVSNGRVFVHSRRDPEETITAINLVDGKTVWQQKYSAAFQKNQYAAEMAKGPHATPLVIGNRLFTLGVTGVLTGWDTATGRELWKRDFSKTIDTSKLFCGTAASPLAVDGRLIVQVGSDLHGGQLLNLDPATGSIGWEWKGPGPGYASPIVIEANGVKQIVIVTQESVVGLETKAGKELWSIPFPDEWHENIMTPIWTGSNLIVSGTRQGTHAFALAQNKPTEVWQNKDVAMYMSSPVFGDGLIYAHSSKRKGQFVAVDAKTGKVKWATEGREGEHASVLLTPQYVLFLTNGADLIITKRAQNTFAVEQRYEVATSPTWAVPIVLGGDLLIRDASSVKLLTAQ
jgi:outer membrane protein assembly factor BamB